MNHSFIWSIFILFFASLKVNAQIILDKRNFNVIGKIASFSYAPERYQNEFRYDIFYYIPTSLTNQSKAKALIFNHGGGDSTLTKKGSIRSVKSYLKDLKYLAEELGIILVLPSANGLNWGDHTRGFMRDLVGVMRQELNIDPNHIGLSGHSMGGMGITRNYYWLADEFSFYLPISAGMDENHQTEENLNKVFNVPYVHLQGRYDHFQIFITRCEEQLKRVSNLEGKYNKKSKFELIFYEGDHNYNYDIMKRELSRLFEIPRDLYQKELYGSLLTGKKKIVDNKITFDSESENRYFWIEAMNSNLSEFERIDFRAKIINNDIYLSIPTSPKLTRDLKIYLHSKMINLNKEIRVFLNDVSVFTRLPSAGQLKNMDPKDPGFMFEDAINIKI